MIRLLFLVALLGFGPGAMAKTTEPLEQMLSLEQFRALPQMEKTLYIKNLQALLVQMNDLQTPQSTADNRLFQMLLPTAYADGEVVNGNVVGGPCIFAGNISTFASNGLCPRPPQGSCASGQIQCNVLVFGEGVCVAPNAKATKNCMQQAKSPKEIIAYAESHKEEWQSMSQTLDGYCANTGTQGYPCRVIQSRLTEMRRFAEAGTPAPAPAAPAPAPAPAPKVETPATKPAPPVAGMPKFRQPRREVGGPGDEKPPRPPENIPMPKAKPNPEVKKETPIEGAPVMACDLERLFEPLICPTDDKLSDKMLSSLMTYPEAYAQFCETRKLDREFDGKVRARYKQITECLTKIVNTNKVPLNVANATKWKTIVEKEWLPNYERCVIDMNDKKLPAIKVAGTMRFEKKTEMNGDVKIENLQATRESKNGTKQVLGNTLLLSSKFKKEKIGLCDYKPKWEITASSAKPQSQKGSQ